MLVDTSGFLCLLHKDEPEHHAAVTIYDAARACLTHNYILAEFVPLSQVRGLPREKSLTFSESILTDSAIEIIWVDAGLHHKAVELMQVRQDKTYSLCDAVSFVIMRERQITEALTTDKHFSQEGFIRLLLP